MSCLFVFSLFFLFNSSANAIGLFDYGINIDGTTYCDIGPCDFDSSNPGPLPGNIDTSGFDFISGLGSITATVSGAGNHFFDLFLDHEIVEATNTFFNEVGGTGGVAAAGQSWEIDGPSSFALPGADIFDNFLVSTLDNSNNIPVTGEDVSMALGWDYNLAVDQTAKMEFLLSVIAPSSGFYLAHTDLGNNQTIYFSSTLNIKGTPTGVPEPGTILLLGAGLIGLVGTYRRRKTLI
jgi:hypothetical protein